MKRLYILIMCGLVLCGATAQSHRNFTTAKQLDIFNSLYRALDLNYVDTLDAKKNIENAITYMLHEIDPYTVYYPAEETEDLRQLSTGKYAGIGSPIVYRPDLNCAVFSDPYMDMPAYRYGVRSGDRIRKINGKVVCGERPSDSQKYLTDITNQLRGEPGTTVTVEVERPLWPSGVGHLGEGLQEADSCETLTLNIVRQQIRRPNIALSKMLDETVGYVSLVGYTENAAAELKTAIQALKSQGMQQLVFDLRGNGGGLLEEAVKMVGLFTKRGTEVVSMRGRNSRSNETFTTSSEPLDRKMPIVVLVDYGTASAAEITCGALQDYDRAVILGSRTYGKGLVQQSITLPYEGALKFTAAKYYIPSGRCIQALDYTHRGTDGQPTHLPDSLCKTFYTAGGRPVRDGGGITPDVKVLQDTLPSLIGYLRMSTQLFDWGVAYQNHHKQISAAEEFRISSDEMADFKAFLKARGFKYDNQSRRKLDDLRNWAKVEGFSEDTKELFNSLEAALAHDLDADFMRWEKELREVAESELLNNFYGDAAVSAYYLRLDPVLKEALAILKDSQRYESILKK